MVVTPSFSDARAAAWTCRSMKPGKTVAFRNAITFRARGCSAARDPTATTFPPSTSTAFALSIFAPVEDAGADEERARSLGSARRACIHRGAPRRRERRASCSVRRPFRVKVRRFRPNCRSASRSARFDVSRTRSKPWARKSRCAPCSRRASRGADTPRPPSPRGRTHARPQQQVAPRARRARARLVHREADDRPDPLLVLARPVLRRAKERLVRLARRDRDPADRRSVVVGDQAGLVAAPRTIPPHRPLLRLAVPDRPVAPVHAPASVGGRVLIAAARSAALEQLDEVAPAPRRERMNLERHSTSSSRGFGRKPRPTFADGRPSVSTTSAVKSFSPRMSAEPTP